MGLELRKLGLLVNLLSEAVALLAQILDLLLAFKKPPLVVVFLARYDAHGVLAVAELEALFLELLSDSHQLFCFLVQFALHLIEIAVEHRNALL